jgi:fused signal recognition particle receptor
VLLVLDATTGQNALVQAREFLAAVGVTGLVLAKVDGTARGGSIFAIARELAIPIKFLGTGETVDDLAEFEPSAFVRALLRGS